MDSPVDILIALLGMAMAGLVAWDVFESVLVPRPTPNRYRLTGFIVRRSWPLWRRSGLHFPPGERRDRFLGTFAPLVVVAFLVCWLIGLVVGLGLVLYALRGELTPAPDLATALYDAGTSVLTLGFVDSAPTGGLARVVSLLAGAAGLGIVALVITYLFMLFGSLQRRETLVVELDARTGAPPSGVALLESFVALDLLDEMPAYFEAWATWSAEVLDTHVAYPILAYFRSSHDSVSWISALGAVLDAACLVVTTLPDLPHGRAELVRRVGSHFVEDISNFLRLPSDEGSGVSRDEFDEARRRLAAAGLRVAEGEAPWQQFERLQASYAGRLRAMAQLWATPTARWIGTVEPPHRP